MAGTSPARVRKPRSPAAPDRLAGVRTKPGNRNKASLSHGHAVGILEEALRAFCSTTGDKAARHRLSPRECEIVRLVARDLYNKEIASVLEISLHTVCTHLRHIFAKLGVRSKAAMVARVLEVAARKDQRPDG